MALLEIRGLHVSYGQIEAIHGVDMDAEAGKITVIIGSNGAGKSTLLGAISGMVKRTGTIRFDGKNLPGASHRVVSAGVIQVPEGRSIFAGLTVEENLRLGAYLNSSARQVRELIERQYELFPRLRERHGQDAGTLSGGEQQMLAVGRALMSRPKLLMMDEPSLGLAPLVVRDIFSIIQEINKQGVTILLIEQNANMALKIADIGYVLETGRITLTGSGEELLTNDAVRAAYLGA